MTTDNQFPDNPEIKHFENVYFYAVLGIISLCYTALRFTFNQAFDPSFF